MLLYSMIGMIKRTSGGGGGGGGGSDVSITLSGSFGGVYGDVFATSATVTITDIDQPCSISIAKSGGGTRYYYLNGVGPTQYTAPFTVSDTDTLAVAIANPGGPTVSGNITVTNVTDASATVATVPYSVTGTYF